MKIGAFDTSLAPGSVGLERRGPAVPRALPSASQDAQVTISSLNVAADGEGSFDAAKVEEIARAIRNGEFKVNAQAIADKLISNAQELLDRSTG